jgi:hypothetical protein
MLTKLNINAMKKADTICFRTENEVSTVECSKKKNENDPYGSSHNFNVEAKHKTIHGGNDNNYCFSYHSLYDFELCPLKTVVSLLKVDDSIKLVWYKDAGATEDLIKNSFISDHFYIEVSRKDKIKYNFLINVSTGRDNSARMIKHHKTF